jgi:Zn-dependent alcohol dehydrogenase
MVSRRFRLEQAKEAFEVFHQGELVKMAFEM